MTSPDTEWFVGYAGLRPLYGKDQHYIVEHHDDGTSTIKIYSAPGVLDETEGPLDEERSPHLRLKDDMGTPLADRHCG